MSKAEVIKNHILNAAQGLGTSEFTSLLKELKNLEKQKTKQVLECISESEIKRLGDLYQKLCNGKNFYLELNCPLRFAVFISADNIEDGANTPYFTIQAARGNEMFDSQIEAEDLLEPNAIINHPDIQGYYNSLKTNMKSFTESLEDLAAKHKLPTSAIMHYLLNEYEMF